METEALSIKEFEKWADYEGYPIDLDEGGYFHVGPYPRYAEDATEKAFKVWMASRENAFTVPGLIWSEALPETAGEWWILSADGRARTLRVFLNDTGAILGLGRSGVLFEINHYKGCKFAGPIPEPTMDYKLRIKDESNEHTGTVA